MSTIIKNDGNQPVDKKTSPDTTGTAKRGTVNKRLKFLDKLDDYKVHHDDVDPRGFELKFADGEKAGEVEGLLADTDSMTVRYVEVEVEDEVIERHTSGHYSEEDRHALIPVGIVRINKSDRTISLLGMESDRFNDYPRYRKGHGYTTGYEIDTNDYLSDFHEYGSKYDRKRYSTDAYRSADTLETGFYNTGFYSENYR